MANQPGARQDERLCSLPVEKPLPSGERPL